MRYSLLSFPLAAPLLASAAPARLYGKRAASDVLVFKFADVLEQLENSFYTQAIAKFQDADFTAAGFSSSQVPAQQFQNIQSDEASHSQMLQNALKSFGETPITGCNFDFSSALADVSNMAATARVVENLGVSAYLGGATLLTDPVLLDIAGSILSVEARHQTILNVLSSIGTAIPAAYDIAFTPSEVLAVASPFISGCNIPTSANTPLSVTNNGTVAPGTLLTFQASTINGTIPEDMLVGGNATSTPLPLSQCVVPNDVNGPVALFITSDGQPLINNVRDRAQDKIVAGPTVAFIDTKPDFLNEVVRPTNSTSGSQPSTSTITISPAQASSIVAGASMAGSSPAASSSSSALSSSSGPNFTTGPSVDGSIIINGWNIPSNASLSSGPNPTNSSSASANATSAGGTSTTDSAVPLVTSSSSSSTISAQVPAAIVNSGAPPTSSSAAAVVASSGIFQTGSPAAVVVVNSGASPTGSSAVAVATSSSTSSSSGGPNQASSVVAGIGGASTTSSDLAASPSSSTPSSSSPNPTTGPSADESIIVNGWNTPSNVSLSSDPNLINGAPIGGNVASTSASATGSVAVAATSSSLSVSSFSSGPSADGSIVINGWSSSS
ncbi:hypothetical protein C0989_004306 [Termitomyces sp. Mn162]|nr:hypothetical protein C0989_004306 [Termitomyces sp. Mn162]